MKLTALIGSLALLSTAFIATSAEANHKRWHCEWKPEYSRWATNPCDKGGNSGVPRDVQHSPLNTNKGKPGGGDNGGGNGGGGDNGGGNGNRRRINYVAIAG